MSCHPYLKYFQRVSLIGQCWDIRISTNILLYHGDMLDMSNKMSNWPTDEWHNIHILCFYLWLLATEHKIFYKKSFLCYLVFNKQHEKKHLMSKQFPTLISTSFLILLKQLFNPGLVSNLVPVFWHRDVLPQSLDLIQQEVNVPWRHNRVGDGHPEEVREVTQGLVLNHQGPRLHHFGFDLWCNLRGNWMPY